MTERRDKRFTLRVDVATLDAWRERAKDEGLSLSALIHQRMSPFVAGSLPEARVGPGQRPAAATPPDNQARILEIAKTLSPEQIESMTGPAEPRRIAAVADCAHPRAARVQVNPSLGLSRCGACGDTIRR